MNCFLVVSRISVVEFNDIPRAAGRTGHPGPYGVSAVACLAFHGLLQDMELVARHFRDLSLVGHHDADRTPLYVRFQDHEPEFLHDGHPRVVRKEYGPNIGCIRFSHGNAVWKSRA